MQPWKGPLLEIFAALWHRLEPWLPGIFGAIVAQMIRPGLGVRQRFIQWTVSVIVFHFVSIALTTIFRWPDAISDVVGFFIAFIAFEALHAWQKAAVEAGVSMISGLPGILKNIAESWGKRPGTPASPPEGD
jgi:hypothetical protein